MKKQKILLIDNYDSFTYNLKHYVEELSGESCDVVRNDEVEVFYAAGYDTLIFSPGPGLPEESGMMMDMIKAFLTEKKILGVCLGHQALGIATGAQLKQLGTVMHGIQRNCFIIKDDPILKDITSPFSAGRYHSWVIDKETISPEWNIIALDEQQEIMLMNHSKYQLTGMQFHPESIMTECGKQMMINWIAG